MKIIYNASVTIIVIVGLISCSDNKYTSDNSDQKHTPDKSIQQFIKQNVILASGFSFDTSKIVTINPFNGESIVPCENTTENIFIPKNLIDTKQEQIQYEPKGGTKSVDTPCNTKIVALDNPSFDTALLQTLKLTESIIKGTVRVNGKDREARILVNVTALYNGSHCTTIYTGGQEIANCVNKEAQCAAIRAATRNPNHPC